MAPSSGLTATEKPLFILTGAGASKWLGKATTFDVYDCPEFRAAADGSGALDDDAIFGRGNSGLKLIGQLRDHLRREDPGGPLDLEALLDFMERTRKQVVGLAKIPGCTEDLRDALAPKRFATARERVLDFIVSYYGDINEALASDLYRPFLDGIVRELKHATGEAPSAIRVFTLNYDEAVEAAADELQSFDLRYGFKGSHTLHWDPSSFDDGVVGSLERCRLLLYKLHGSASWTRSRETSRIEKTLYLQRRHPGRDHVILFPTQGDKPIDQAPFSVAYDALRSALSDSLVGLFIGTSFRDKEICTEIKKRADSGQPFRLIAVNPKIDPETVSSRTGVREKDIRIVSVGFEPPTLSQVMDEVRSSLAELADRGPE